MIEEREKDEGRPARLRQARRDYEEAVKQREKRPVPNILPTVICKIEDKKAMLFVAEAKSLMKMLRPLYRADLEYLEPEGGQSFPLYIPLELFQCLLKWIQIHAADGRGLGTRQLRKLDRKNLATYAKIFVLDDEIVEEKVLDNILASIKGIVLSAEDAELSDFVRLVYNIGNSRDEKKKLKVLRNLLALKSV